MKKTREGLENIAPSNEEHEIEMNTFLSEINSNIVEIRKSENNKYSILSSIFNCFYEKKALSLPKQTILEYIHQDIINHKGKMIVSFVENGTNSMKIINEDNYIKKTLNIISRNKCLIQENNNKISIDMIFIQEHKNLVFKNLFGKNGKFFNSQNQKLKKLKRLKLINANNIKKRNIKENQKDGNSNEEDYEIEILESEQDEADKPNSKKAEKKLSNDTNPKSDSNSTNFTKNSFNPDNDNINKNNNINNNNKINISQNINPSNAIYLNKKRKMRNIDIFRKKEEKNRVEYNKIMNNLIKNNDKDIDDKSENISILKMEEDKDKKVEIVGEKEILSFVEEGKLFLSLFKDKELLSEFENQKNHSDEADSYIKSILVNYHNNDELKNCLNLINDDYIEFQNSLKSLIDCKSSYDNSDSNKFLGKFSMMDKIILGKEKCNLIIDKIITKLNQLILEYSFIKKTINNFDSNKADFFQKLKDIMTNAGKKPEKENYVNNLKLQLKKELNKALDIEKGQGEKNI